MFNSIACTKKITGTDDLELKPSCVAMRLCTGVRQRAPGLHGSRSTAGPSHVEESNAHARCNQRIGQCSRRDLRSSVNAVLLGLLVLTCWTTSLIEGCLVALCDFLRRRSEHTMRCRENTEILGCSVRHTPKFTKNSSERVAGPPRFLGFC